MAREDNLIPFNERTKEEARLLGTLGGIKSGEVRRARKTLREELLLLLENEDTQKNITVALLKEAEKGNIKAFEVLRDTVGEKPIDKVESSITVKDDKLNDLIETLKD